MSCKNDSKTNISQIVHRLDTFFNINEEDIYKIINYIKSDENQDKDLQKCKDLPDEELANVIVKRIQNEVYSTLQKLSRGEI